MAPRPFPSLGPVSLAPPLPRFRNCKVEDDIITVSESLRFSIRVTLRVNF